MIQKQQIIEDFGRDAKDTGSPEAQVAILTARIQSLTEHFKKHKQDYHGQRGLTKIVGKRRSLLQYLKRKNTDRYLDLVKRLGIRR